MQAAGQPPAWSSYIAVADADESAGKVKEAGGNVIAPPFELPNESGRMAVCQDAEGAFFCVMQEREHKGAELVNEIGCWAWNNLLCRDLDRARDFYGTIFGWEATQSDEQPPGILNWQLDGQRWPEGLGGLMEMGSDMPAETPSHWQVYFSVESAEGVMEQVSKSGGATLLEPLSIPVGKLAVFNDPQGANFAIFESHYPEPR